MVIHNPPIYRYPLSDDWDKDTFELIKELASKKKYPEIIGEEDDINQFLITLIRTQKSLHDWRDFLKEAMEQVKTNGNIITKELNQKYPPESISKEVPGWVTYEDDKIANDFIDVLESRKIQFKGENSEIGEFVLRFILGQLGSDWVQTVEVVWEMLGDKNIISVKDLNNEFRNLDYCHLFK